MSPRILVTVSRSWHSWSTMRTALELVHQRYPDAVLVHGCAPKGNMVESAPNLALAFIHNASKGASHCSGLAIDAGIPTLVYRQGVDGVETHNVEGVELWGAAL